MKKVKWLATVLFVASIALGVIGSSCSRIGVAQVDVVPEVFVLVEGTTITGTESWTPESKVFVRGRSFTIPNLYVSDHEVTRGEYKAVMGKDPSTGIGYDKDGNGLGVADLNNPVIDVNWYDAIVYCNKRSMAEGLTPCYSIDGSTNPDDWGAVPTDWNDPLCDTWDAATCDFNVNGYRLPTEAEWEYAARAGDNTVDSLTYSGTSDVNKLGEYAWYSNSSSDNTYEVGKKLPNAFGLYDMSGNVWEWCWNWYTNSYDEETEGGSDPIGTSAATAGTNRVCRGGCCSNLFRLCAVSYRDSGIPGIRSGNGGFRVVRASSN